MTTRDVVLTTQQEQFVGELVATGRNQNASEVLREGLRLLQDNEHLRQAQLEGIQARLLEGLDQYKQGESAVGTGEEAIERALSAAIQRRR